MGMGPPPWEMAMTGARREDEDGEDMLAAVDVVLAPEVER